MSWLETLITPTESERRFLNGSYSQRYHHANSAPTTRKSLFDIFRRKPKKEGMAALEERLAYVPEQEKVESQQSRRKFLKESAYCILGTTILVGSCAGGLRRCTSDRFEDRTVPNYQSRQTIDSTTHSARMEELRPYCQQISEEENIPEYILEGMILASSEENSYSLHQRRQGLGGVVLLNPLEVGVTLEMLNRDPSLSLRIAARQYNRIRRRSSDDEAALAEFFSSYEEMQSALERAESCRQQEMKRDIYLTDGLAEDMSNRQKTNMLREANRLNLQGEEKEQFIEENIKQWVYPNPNIDFIRDHEQNALGMYYINNLNEFAREAVKLALFVHPDYQHLREHQR